MQSQLDWDKKKYIKFEMKKGRSIEIALKGGEGGLGILL